MKKLFIFVLIGIGAAGGWFYYNTVGCVSGTCPITNNPYTSTLYGAFMGFAVANLFSLRNKNESFSNEDRNDNNG